MSVQASGGWPLQYVGFNQDASFVVAGTANSFLTCSTEPFTKGTQRTFENGIGVVELLYRTNLLALVGGGSCPQFPTNKVMIWDDTKKKCVGELSFYAPVKTVRMRRDIILVVLEKKIYVYNFADLQVRHSFDTSDNPGGLAALSIVAPNWVLAYPDTQLGSVAVRHLGVGGVDREVAIQAHETELGALATDRQGKLIATASKQGTLIRVFSALTGERLVELRRGIDRAIVYSLCFNHDATLLASSSDKCTVHIFDTSAVAGGTGAVEHEDDPDASLAGRIYNFATAQLKTVLPKSMEARRSAMCFAVEEAPTVCAFGSQPNSILVAGMNGSLAQYQFDLSSQRSERSMIGWLLESEG